MYNPRDLVLGKKGNFSCLGLPIPSSALCMFLDYLEMCAIIANYNSMQHISIGT